MCSSEFIPSYMKFMYQPSSFRSLRLPIVQLLLVEDFCYPLDSRDLHGVLLVIIIQSWRFFKHLKI